MKDVTLQDAGSLPVIVFCLVPMTHEELAAPYVAKGYQVVSAAFVRFDRFTGQLVPYGHSTSLKKGPAADDAELLNALYNATLGGNPA
jgi:hypothetical protein